MIPLEERPPDALRVVWTQPRLTIRWLLEHGDGGLWALLLFGAVMAHEGFRLADADPGRVSTFPVVVEFLIATLFWYVLALFFACTLDVFGVALGGRGRFRDLRIALGWSLAPLAASLPFVVLYVFGLRAAHPLPAEFASGVVSFLYLFSLTLLVACVREAHDISWAKSVLVVALGYLITIIAGVAIFLLLVQQT
jgi:hypothetical protein